MKRGFNPWQTHCSMHPSIFNRFPVIQPASSKVRHFSTFFAQFGLPWVRLWDNCGKCHTDGKRVQCLSNASQHVPIYLLRYSKLLVENCDIFILHLCLAPLQGVTPSEFREDLECRYAHKTRMNRLSYGDESMTICSAVLIQYQRVTDRRTDRRTDRQTEYQYRASAKIVLCGP